MNSLLLALYGGVRGSIYVSLLLLIGHLAVGKLVAAVLSADPTLNSSIRQRLAGLARRVTMALTGLILARGALQVGSLTDADDPVTPDLIRGAILSGHWGHAWLLQLAAAVLLALAVRINGPGTPRWRAALPLLTALLVWAQSGMGHAATNRWPQPLGRVLDSLHLAGAGIWLGTLGVLAMIVLPLLQADAQLPSLAGMVRAFSRLARAGVLLVLISGTVAALVYAGSITLFLHSSWGRLLLIKLTAMIGVLALGWYNWRVVTPALEGSTPACRTQLQRAVRLELVLALTMLAITAWLVASPLPGEA